MANAIMQQTLPTVIAMGVTSRAIDTTMGRQQRASRGRSKKRKGTMQFKVYKGKRGGYYIKRKGRKIYL